MRSALLAFVLTSACVPRFTVEPEAEGGAVEDSEAETPESERTLATCRTKVAADAPSFFRRYFRCVTITTTPSTVVIASEDLPPHRSYYWGEGHPNFEPLDLSRGESYRPSAHRIAPQHIEHRIPKAPIARGITVDEAMIDGAAGTHEAEYPPGAVGIALDSVALFSPHAAARDPFSLDDYDAQPEALGVYHTMTASRGPLEVLAEIGLVGLPAPGSANVELYGIMCDGTLVLGCTELDGYAPKGPFDAQGGHVHDVIDAARTVSVPSRYHVHVCPTLAGFPRHTPEIQYYTTCSRG